MCNLESNQHRRAVAEQQPLLLGPIGVVLGRHEDRAALRVVQDVKARLGVDREAIVGGPVQHGLAAAAQDGDVEGADLDPLQDLDSTAGRCRREAQI